MMISILHAKINDITPIHGVADNGDGSYRVDYITEPTDEQADAVNAILASWPLERAKLIKLEELDQKWEETLDNGWATPYGWKLGLSTQDIALLNGNFTLAKEASFMGITDPVFVIDTDGESHEFDLQDLTMLMLQYGQARAILSSQDAVKRKAIKNSASIEDLSNIGL